MATGLGGCGELTPSLTAPRPVPASTGAGGEDGFRPTRGLPHPKSFKDTGNASLFPKMILLNAHKVHPWVCKVSPTSEEAAVLM